MIAHVLKTLHYELIVVRQVNDNYYLRKIHQALAPLDLDLDLEIYEEC